MPKCIYDLETQEYKCNINNEVYVFKDKEEMIFNLIQYKKKNKLKVLNALLVGRDLYIPFPHFRIKRVCLVLIMLMMYVLVRVLIRNT